MAWDPSRYLWIGWAGVVVVVVVVIGSAMVCCSFSHFNVWRPQDKYLGKVNVCSSCSAALFHIFINEIFMSRAHNSAGVFSHWTGALELTNAYSLFIVVIFMIILRTTPRRMDIIFASNLDLLPCVLCVWRAYVIHPMRVNKYICLLQYWSARSHRPTSHRMSKRKWIRRLRSDSIARLSATTNGIIYIISKASILHCGARFSYLCSIELESGEQAHSCSTVYTFLLEWKCICAIDRSTVLTQWMRYKKKQ